MPEREGLREPGTGLVEDLPPHGRWGFLAGSQQGVRLRHEPLQLFSRSGPGTRASPSEYRTDSTAPDFVVSGLPRS